MADEKIADLVCKVFDFTPSGIISALDLRRPIYRKTAAYGHFGRDPYVEDGIQFFGWEKLDSVDLLRKEFNI